MPKIYNIHKDKDIPADAVYIGRPSIYGNPFRIGADGNRTEVINKYENWVRQNPFVLSMIKNNLKGKDLYCYCPPLPCHGEVILKLLHEMEE